MKYARVLLPCMFGCSVLKRYWIREYLGKEFNFPFVRENYLRQDNLALQNTRYD